jgi:thioredoxin
MNRSFLPAVLLILSSIGVDTFVLITRRPHTPTSRLFVASSSSQSPSDLSSLRVSEIKAELQERQIDYTDCFDKESLLERLKQARASIVEPTETTVDFEATLQDDEYDDDEDDVEDEYDDDEDEEDEDESSKASPAPAANVFPLSPPDEVDEQLIPIEETIQQQQPASSTPPPRVTSTKAQDSTHLLNQLRQKSVKELRQELASRNLRWSGLLEKQDLVKAVFDAIESTKAFSATGRMVPGQVTELTDKELEQEIQARDKGPLLVDVYATWCGPCQLMATELKQAAAELNTAVRFAKLDSDQYQQLSGQLRVQGLPTLILFEYGEEMKRIEGALTKSQLMGWIAEE